MKKVGLCLMIFLVSFSLFAGPTDKVLNEKEHVDPLICDGGRFGMGVMVSMESPVLVGNEKTLEPGRDLKNVDIYDFVFGIPMQADWIWQNSHKVGVGLKLDFDFLYTPLFTQKEYEEAKANNYTVTEGINALPHGLRFEFAPMLSAKFNFFRLSVGPSLLLDMNCTTLSKHETVTKGEDTVKYLNDLGLTLDVAFRSTLDFEIGDHFVIGGVFKLNGGLNKSDYKVPKTSENIEGVIGLRMLGMF